MIQIRFLATALACALLASCASAPRSTSATESPPTVLLLSIDGMRGDKLDRHTTPTLFRLAKEGVHSTGMRPSYPSLTFPNHYTLVTGLRPDRHGLVHNTMRSDELGSFRLNDRQAVQNPAWWEEGEPVWISVRKAGYKSASWSWPGSEAPIHGLYANQWQRYDESVSLPERMQQVLAWLRGAPDGVIPRFVAAYMEHVDQAGHRHGPDSPQYAAALRQVDAAIGQLVDAMAREGLLERTNIVIVSDHGMATVREGNVVAIEDMVAPDLATPVTMGQSVGFRPLPGKKAEAEQALLGAHERYQCWNKAQLPARWHYGTHPRIPPIVCQMHEGWDAMPRPLIAQRTPGDRGSHGYDPALPSMQAIFIGRGPAFVRGRQLGSFDNVDVYPLLTRLAGIPARPNDGDPQALQDALRTP